MHGIGFARGCETAQGDDEMRWLSLLMWTMLAVYGGRRPGRRLLTAAMLTAGLAVSMAGQMFLLWQDGLLSLQTGLPLHICGMMAALSIPLVWLRPGWLYGFSLYLGMPCAAMALVFPAVISCSRPLLMAAHFDRLHGLILACGLFVMAQEKPLPRSGAPAFLLGSGYLLFVWRINFAIGSNYLFLRAAPRGTPLEWLVARGEGFTLCSYLLLAMVVIRLMSDVWLRLYPLVTAAGSRTSYNRCCRRS